MATFVLVHGAGTGGWLSDDVLTKLKAGGHQVLAPSLGGVGGQQPDVSLGSSATLSEHVDQIVRLVRGQQLDQVVLVGFSYGGYVITGAAGGLGTTVSQLIYVDAFWSEPGRSFFDQLPAHARTLIETLPPH
jgi:pimeloyl-ACP methyl ester carboxylesterase